ncbi:MAG TPA: hypothetical protein VN081_07100 [Dongiaceae bacterium]|nr:hypothetical protein [Dongiaceae bacterium]
MTLTEGTEKLAQALLLPINPAAVIILGIYTVVWGIWVSNPLWEVFSHAPLYMKMAAFMPEWAWGVLAIIMGGITIYGAVRRYYAALVRGAASSGFFWLIVAIFYFVGDAANTGGITALVFAVYAFFIYLNIRVNFKNDKTSPFLLDPPRFRNPGK